MNLRLPSALQLPAALFAGALLLGGSAFYLALETRSASQTGLLATRQQAEAATHDLRRAPERLAQDRAQAATYAQLRASGFIGAEDRLDWLSRLAQLQGDMQLGRLSWRLAAQEASTLGNGLRRSRMDLDFSPTDPARLDLFVDKLRKQAHGRFTINACTLLPDAGGGVASCTLDWWTWNGD